MEICRIHYGEYKWQHVDEVEKTEKGFIAKYVGNGAINGPYKTFEDLLESYLDSKIWLYVGVDKNNEFTVHKDTAEKLAKLKPSILEKFEREGDTVFIKIYQVCGCVYYCKEVCNNKTNEKTITIKLLSY